MGGDSFTHDARRLTTVQLDSLAEYCSSALHQAGLFKGDIGRYKHFTSKDTHGDLDLVCAYDSSDAQPSIHVIPSSGQTTASAGRDTLHMVGTKRGLPTDKLDDPLAEELIAKIVIAKLIKEARASSLARGATEHGEVQRGEGEREGEGVAAAVGARRLAILVCRALGASEWVWNWPVLSYAVPVRAIGVEEAEEDGAEPFFQVDIFPVLPAKVHFTTFICSYSHCRHLLSQLFRLLSPSLELRYIDLQLHHTPFPGGKRIEIELTSSPEEMCEWLGLDYQRFAHGPAFEDQEGLWKWLTDVEPDSLVDLSLRKVVEKVRESQVSAGEMTDGRTGLSSSQSEEILTPRAIDNTLDTGDVNSASRPTSVPSLGSEHTSRIIAKSTKIRRQFTTHRGLPTMENFATWLLNETAWGKTTTRRDSGIIVSPTPALTASPISRPISPSQNELLAIPLDPIALAALAHFGGLGLQTDCEVALEQRRQEAQPLWEARKRKDLVKMANIAKARRQVEAMRANGRMAEGEAI